MVGGIIGVKRKNGGRKGRLVDLILAVRAALGLPFHSYGYPVPERAIRVYVDFTIRNWFYYS